MDSDLQAKCIQMNYALLAKVSSSPPSFHLRFDWNILVIQPQISSARRHDAKRALTKILKTNTPEQY
jgi:hypothetical protein